MNKNLLSIIALVVGVSALFLSVVGLQNTPKNLTVGDAVIPSGLTTYNISGAGISSSATSIGLASLTIPQTGQKLIDSDFSDTFYLTIDPGNRTRQEFASCTTVTQNGAGTATLSGCSRGLSPISPYTASTTLQFAHSGGAQVIFSNSPQFYNQYTAKGNAETITGSWSFPVPSSANNPATKGYADQLVAVGVATSSESNFGGVWLGTASQAASSTDGAPNKPYVLQTKYATDTPNTATRATKVLMSDMTGYLKQGWLNLSQTFTWTGLHTFSAGFLATASSTHSATTTIAASSVSNNALLLNGVAYQFPSSQTANYFLKTNGSGVLTWATTTTNIMSTSTTFAAPTANGNTTSKTVYCESPKVVSGGGFSGLSVGTAADFVKTIATPIANYASASNAWTVTLGCVTGTVNSPSCASDTVTITALCVNP